MGICLEKHNFPGDAAWASPARAGQIESQANRLLLAESASSSYIAV